MSLAESASNAPATHTVFCDSRRLRNSAPLATMATVLSMESGGGTLFQVRHQPAGGEHQLVGTRQLVEWQRSAAAMVAHDAGAPIDLDLVPALDEVDDAGAADLREAHADLAAPIAGREGFGDDSGDAEMPHGAHWRIVRVAIAEILGA